MTIEYALLGPLEVRLDRRPLPVSSAKIRTLLALLVLQANQVVPTDRLVDELWCDDPPAGARNLVQKYVSGLRALLGCPTSGGFLLTTPSGYLLEAGSEQVDVARFQELVRVAERCLAEGHAEPAGRHLREALGQWRGPVLAGFTSPRLLGVAARLEEQRLAALERRTEVDLVLGRHRELIGELTQLVADHPLRESLHARLMLALYRAGRRADALRAYDSARRTLARDLGVEPGPELRQLEQQVRAADPALQTGSGPAAGVAGQPHPAVPSQLPRGIRDFVGRAEPLAAARRLLDVTGDDAPASRILVVTGPGGVGKTTFALRLAHALRDRFPDGQLFWDLRGPETEAVGSDTVLAAFLRALGVHGSAIPADATEREAMYRSRLADRRVLVLLDNAAGERQVRPLLAGGPGCAVIVTSRAGLTGLEAAASVPLGVLRQDEALELLAKVAGRGRVAAEPEAARALVELCGGLPLAVRVAGARLANRPRWRLAMLADRLGDERGRLDELRVGDLAVRASLALSYRGLDAELGRAFRLLGELATPDFAAWEAAAMLEVNVARAESLLEPLVDARLLEAGDEDAAGQLRYHFHPLVQVYARERREEMDPLPALLAALERAFAARLALTSRARVVLAPGEIHGVPVLDVVRLPEELAAPPAVERASLAWLEAEREGLVAAVAQASEVGLSRLAWQLVTCPPAFLMLRSWWQGWRSAKLLALEAVRRDGDRRGEGRVLFGIGMAVIGTGDLAGARAYLDAALTAFTDVGDEHSRLNTGFALALLALMRGELDGAERLLDDYASRFREAGDRYGEALALQGLADLHRVLGRLQAAEAAVRRSLAMFQESGDRYWEGLGLRLLGDVHQRQGRLAEAAGCLERSLGIARDFGDAYFEARILYDLGKVRQGEGAPARAAECFRRSAGLWEKLALHDRAARARARLVGLDRLLARASAPLQ